MAQLTRNELDRLTAFFAERIGTPCESGEEAGHIEPLCRQVRHAVTGIDAYLEAVETRSPAAAHLHGTALDLWQGLERLADAWAGIPVPQPAPGAAVPAGA
ncbi:hypothetical protein GCM10009639_04000 [Kitasatospora putterlickiae]|uniref:Uncharacterized protein n=1 Tax=Kitasatospora putterlickiae TaxID=221725 RepID=A0ABN1XJU8_9ACTN